MGPIHDAATYGQIDVISNLITKHKVDPKCRGKVYNRRRKCTWFVLELYLFQVGMQAIHNAAVSGHADLMVLLIEQFGVDPQEKAEVTKSRIAT